MSRWGRASASGAAASDATASSAEDSPQLISLQKALKALLRRGAQLHELSESVDEVDAFCSCFEDVLMHKFKSKQFYMFTVQPWSLVEQTEEWGVPEAEAVKLARDVGKTDAARLRAWIFVQLNQRCLQQSMSAIVENAGLLGTFYYDTALLRREDCQQLIVDLLRPLTGLSFRLGAAAGLASVAVVSDLDMAPSISVAAASDAAVADVSATDVSVVDEAAADEAAVVDAVAAVAQVPAVATAEATRETTEDHSVKSAPASPAVSAPEQELPPPFANGLSLVTRPDAPQTNDPTAAASQESDVERVGSSPRSLHTSPHKPVAAPAAAFTLVPGSPCVGGEVTASSGNDGWQTAVSRHGSVRRNTRNQAKRSIAPISTPPPKPTTQTIDPCLAAIIAAASPTQDLAGGVPLPEQATGMETDGADEGHASSVASSTETPSAGRALGASVRVMGPGGSVDESRSIQTASGNPWEVGEAPLNPWSVPAHLPTPWDMEDDASVASFLRSEMARSTHENGKDPRDASRRGVITHLSWSEGLARAAEDEAADALLREPMSVPSTTSPWPVAAVPNHVAAAGALPEISARPSDPVDGLFGSGPPASSGPSQPSRCASCQPTAEPTPVATPLGAVEAVASALASTSLDALLQDDDMHDAKNEPPASSGSSSFDADESMENPRVPRDDERGVAAHVVLAAVNRAASVGDAPREAPIASPAPHQAPQILASVDMDYFRPGGGLGDPGETPPPPRSVHRAESSPSSRLSVRSVQLLGTERRESTRSRTPSLSGSFSNLAEAASTTNRGAARTAGRTHVFTVYELRARVGPFECTSYRRFSDFLRLHRKLQHAAAGDRASRQTLHAATPTAKKLRDSKLSMAPRDRQIEQRTRLLQQYCTELCASQQLARSEAVTAFFWPEDGTGSVVAPDGSMASMTGSMSEAEW